MLESARKMYPSASTARPKGSKIGAWVARTPVTRVDPIAVAGDGRDDA